MKYAIPTDAPGGLGGRRAAHFGHCDIFTIVDVGAENEVFDVQVLVNKGHDAEGCMSPIKQLQKAGVDAVVVSGLGMRPMQVFNQAGISVYYADSERFPDVSSVIGKIGNNDLILMHADQACKGSENCQY